MLKKVGECEIKVEFSTVSARWVPATRIRSVEVKFGGYSTTLGTIIGAEDHGASRYPNEIRYGEMPKDFPPEALSCASTVLVGWVEEFWDKSRISG